MCGKCGNELHESKFQCQQCGQPKGEQQYSPSMWHDRGATGRKILCLDCEAQKPMVTCSICKVSKPVDRFSASALRHKSQRDIRCLDCSNAPCMFLPKCETCTKCRNPKCKKSNCREAAKPVNSQELPASFEEVMNFACQSCRYVRCIVKQPDGTLCGRKRRHNAQATARKNRTAYSCAECQTWLLSQESWR